MEVILSKPAEKQFFHLPKIIQIKMRKKLLELRLHPYEGKKLGGELRGIRSLRVWPYRILYTVNEKRERVEVLKIAHRQGVYT